MLDIPYHKREIEISVTIKDRDHGNTYEIYNINEELRLNSLSITCRSLIIALEISR